MHMGAVRTGGSQLLQQPAQLGVSRDVVPLDVQLASLALAVDFGRGLAPAAVVGHTVSTTGLDRFAVRCQATGETTTIGVDGLRQALGAATAAGRKPPVYKPQRLRLMSRSDVELSDYTSDHLAIDRRVAGTIAGLKKTVFNSKDFGTIVMSSYSLY